jgi:hypothetical protein
VGHRIVKINSEGGGGEGGGYVLWMQRPHSYVPPHHSFVCLVDRIRLRTDWVTCFSLTSSHQSEVRTCINQTSTRTSFVEIGLSVDIPLFRCKVHVGMAVTHSDLLRVCVPFVTRCCRGLSCSLQFSF